jgi:hypothetical protein
MEYPVNAPEGTDALPVRWVPIESATVDCPPVPPLSLPRALLCLPLPPPLGSAKGGL